ARLTLGRHRNVEGVHDEALAAADAPPQIHPERHVWPLEQLLESRGARFLEVDPFIVVALQTLEGALLRRIRRVAALCQRVTVIHANVHERPGTEKQGRGCRRPFEWSPPDSGGQARCLRVSTRLRSSAYACRQSGPLP